MELKEQSSGAMHTTALYPSLEKEPEITFSSKYI